MFLCRGGSIIFIIASKYSYNFFLDNVKILFYEKDVQDGWKAYATFNPSDVHYQVFILFESQNVNF